MGAGAWVDGEGDIATPDPAWLSITAYAHHYGVSRKTVWKWLTSGLLETYRVGRCLRIKNMAPLVTKSPELRKSKARGKLG